MINYEWDDWMCLWCNEWHDTPDFTDRFVSNYPSNKLALGGFFNRELDFVCRRGVHCIYEQRRECLQVFEFLPCKLISDLGLDPCAIDLNDYR